LVRSARGLSAASPGGVIFWSVTEASTRSYRPCSQPVPPEKLTRPGSWPVRTTTMPCDGNTVTSWPNRPEKRYMSGGIDGMSRVSLTGRSWIVTPMHGLPALTQISQP
jgi:hypothetical protein